MRVAMSRKSWSIARGRALTRGAVGQLISCSIRGEVVDDDAPEVDDCPWERPGAFRLDCEPHRSGLLLALGKVSLALGIASWFLLVPALPGLLLGLSAFLLSWRDLKVMRSGLMDQAGERQTRRATHAALAGVALNLVGGYFLCRHLFWFFTD
jgi:hypothetical protein